MRTIAATKNSLTKTVAIALAAVGIAAMPAQAAQTDRVATGVAAPAATDHTRPAPGSTQRPTKLKDAPRPPVRSCYDAAIEIADSLGWFDAAAAYFECITNPNAPENDEGAGSPAPKGPTALADAFREPSRSCYDYAVDVYISSGWWEAASAYMDCYGNPNHPENTDKP